MTDATIGDPGVEGEHDDSTLVITQHVAAPPDTVFDFLVEEQKMLRWMGVAAELDPRPGGRFKLQANKTDVARGEYVEVERPNRVVFTWGWEGSDHVPPGSSTVVFNLTPADDGTTNVELRHIGLPGGRDDEHRKGWTHLFDRLAIAASGGQPGADEMHGIDDLPD